MNHNNSAISAAGRRGFSVAPPLRALPGRADAVAAAGVLGGGRSRDRGKESGMRNSGNSCYLNAVLQALLGQRSFVRDLLFTACLLKGQLTCEQRDAAEREEQTRERAADDARIAEEQGDRSDMEANNAAASRAVSPHTLSDTFTQSLLSLVRDMRRSSHGILDAKQLQQMIARRYTRFAGDDQQDAHEFLSECLTSLDDDILKVMQPTHSDERKEGGAAAAAASSSSSSATAAAAASPPSFSSPSSLQLQVDTLSPIYRNFHSEIEQRLECASCGYTRCKSEHFNELSLDLPEELLRAAGAPSPTHDRSAPSPSAARETPEPRSPSSSPQSPTENARPRRLNRNHSGNSSEGSAALTGARSTASPAPAPVAASPPECPKHHRLMAPMKDSAASAAAVAAAAVAGSVLFKCPAQRCKEIVSIPADAVGRFPAPLPASSSTQSLNSALAKLTPSSSAANGAAAPAAAASTVRRPGKGGPTGPIASLSELLSRFFSSQLIEYRCERCSGNLCKKSYAFRQLPRVLILHLKRFMPNYRTGSYDKRTERVRVDEAIDLGFACTTQTRKPMPVQDAVTPATSTAGRGSPKPAAAAAAATNAFSALFASSSAAACKCGASADQCTHANGIHTTPEEIAAFIAAQHEPAAAATADPDSGARSPSSRNGKLKRKSGQLAPVDAGSDGADSSNKKTRNARSSASPSPSPATDSDSYFANSSSESAAAQTVSARINVLHADIRHLQQQISDVSRAPSASSSFSSGAAAGFVAVPTVAALSDRKREALLQQHVMKLSVLESELRVQMDAQAALHREKGKTISTRANPVSAAAATAAAAPVSSSSPSPPLQGALPAALGPSVVPVYELQSVIHHRGSIATSGHYLTDLKSEAPGLQGGAGAGGWRRFDDQYVRALDSNQAMSYGESAGYIFFYSYQPLLNLEILQQQQQMQQNANGSATAAASSSSSSSSAAAAANSSGAASPSHTPMQL